MTAMTHEGPTDREGPAHAGDFTRLLKKASGGDRRDLDGRDSLDKLRVLALSCGIDVRSTELAWADVRAATPGGQLRQVATLDAEGQLTVALESVEPGDALYDLPGEWNAAEITGADGSVTVVRGRGAGRWPTAEAGVAG